ncbi:hypothetical protein [Actinophytocola sp.]|uniref:hypothetical protein n=1 Tax=Actinophytocola sp. TaxID=1872138 RepID=UPI003D6AEF00
MPTKPAVPEELPDTIGPIRREDLEATVARVQAEIFEENRAKCRNPHKNKTCVESLAEGWIGVPDLCAGCTRVFMHQLDAAVGPLAWHTNYTARAER